LCVTLVAGLQVGRDEARGLSRLDRPNLSRFRVTELNTADTCSMLELFDQIARQAKIAIGFENAPGCGLGPRSLPKESGRMLEARTAREAFDEVAAVTGAFSWREIDGVVVIRPLDAWQKAGFLNLRVDAFQLVNVSLDDALCHALDVTTPRLRCPRPRRSLPQSQFDVPMSVDFAGGPLLSALNAIVRARGGAEWFVGYANESAAIMIGALSRLDSSVTAFVAPIAWKSTSVTPASAR
jgi:hypothetical protein